MQQNIIDIAEKLLKERGYHGWSYQDISDKVGIKKASIHYHFPRKQDLGVALIKNYSANLNQAIEEINNRLPDAKKKIFALANLYGQLLKENNAFCLCGFLVADLLTLPIEMQEELKTFFKSQKDWIKIFLEEGKREKIFKKFHLPLDEEASLLINCLQGILLITRLEAKPFESYTKLSNELLIRQLN